MPYILPVEMQYRNRYGKRALPPESIVLTDTRHYYRATSDDRWRNDYDAYKRHLDNGGQNDVNHPAPFPADHVRFEVGRPVQAGDPDWDCITLGDYQGTAL